MTKKLILVLVSLWWGWTAIIDFVIVPTVFRTVSDFFNAGELGIAIFSKLNILEVSIGLLLIILNAIELNKHKTKRLKIQTGLVTFCWIICLTYMMWLTPKIAELTHIWEKADAADKIGVSGIPDIQQLHQIYHGLYKTLDSFKLVLLTVVLGLITFRKESEVAKA